MTTTESPTHKVRLTPDCDISKFCYSTGDRYVLTHMHFRARYLEATDGKMLIRVPYPAGTEPAEGLTAMVPAASVQKALKAAGRKGAVDVTLNGNAKLEAAGGTTVTAELGEGTFPNTQAVIPTEDPTLSITLSASLLAVICEHAKKHTAGACHGIRFDFTADGLSPVRFSYKLDGEREATGVLMPMRMS